MNHLSENITQLLFAWQKGDHSAENRLMEIVYRELKKISSAHLKRRDWGKLDIQTTELLNDTYLRLSKQKSIKWENRTQFFGIVAKLMRQVMVDHARNRQAEKRGGKGTDLSFREEIVLAENRTVSLKALDQALDDLERLDQRKSQIVELRFFAGLNLEECAQLFDCSSSTVKREWAIARAWLFRYLAG